MESQSRDNSILKRWRERQKSEKSDSDLPKAPKEALIPTSFGQQRLWFLQQLYPKNPVYNYSELFTFTGGLDKSRLLKALTHIFRSNDILRTSYHLENGRVVQQVHDLKDLPLTEADLSALSLSEKEKKKKELLDADAKASFALNTPPLMRLTLIQEDAHKTLLLVTMHHIITDKWSMSLFADQLAGHYRTFRTGDIAEGEEKLQFTDYAYWQRQREIPRQELTYWLDKLAGEIPYLPLPTDYPQPVQLTFRGKTVTRPFSADLSKKILDLANASGTTPYVLLLSAFYVLLYRYSGERDILVGSPVSTRNLKALERMIGFFDETVILRASLEENMSFADLLDKVKRTTLEAFSNTNVPFDALVKELKPERALNANPFFRTMFIYHAVPKKPYLGSGLELLHEFYDIGVSKFDLTLYLSNDNGQLSASIEYFTDLFEEGTVIQLLAHYQALLESIVKHPGTPLNSLAMLSQVEKERALAKPAKEPGPFHSYNSIHEIIESIAVQKPKQKAVIFEDDSLTYEELNSSASKLSRAILAQTGGQKVIIGLCVERSPELIIGLLAILKSGCAYMPIDPDYPETRVAQMIEDSGSKYVVTNKIHQPLFTGQNVLLIPAGSNITEVEEPEVRAPEVHKTDLAYVIFTSGSSGRPKGVPISHENLLNSTEGRLLFYPSSPTSFLLLSSISFDSSKAGIFWTLCTGGALVVSKKYLEQDIGRLIQVIKKQSVSHTLMLPSLYKVLLDYSKPKELKSLEGVIVAGESCSPAICAQHFDHIPDTLLFNEYGPTEATVWCVAHQVSKKDINASIPIGKPVANAQILLLDDHLKLVPKGGIGEIYIGGPGLTRGYLNRPDLTEKAFVPNPFSEDPDEMLYKTGDLGRLRKDDVLEFIGRKDQQVKIRGYRIELEEVENALMKQEEVSGAVVIAEDISKNNLQPPTPELLVGLLQNLDETKRQELLKDAATLTEKEKQFLLEQIKVQMKVGKNE